MTVNPYTSRGPLRDARMFFGRDYELNEIAAFLHGNQSVSIVGPHKIGKTSLLLHLMQPETMTGLNIGHEMLFVYIDCQALSHLQQYEIFNYIFSEATAASQAAGIDLEPTLRVPASGSTWTAFEVIVRRLNQCGHKLVLILDGFEHLTMNPHLDVSFFNALRSLAGRLGVMYLTATRQPLIELTDFESSTKLLSSPLFNIFAQLFLGLFSEPEVIRLIRTPMEAVGYEASPQLKSFIYQLVGGHPFALQVACFHAWDRLHDLPEIELRTRQALEEHFLYCWQSLNPAERDVSRHLSEARVKAVNDPSIKIALRDLIRMCLLVQVEGSYTYPSKLWAEFVSAQRSEPEIVLIK